MNNQWLQYGPTSNKFRQSYIKGFLDVSGTSIIRNGSLHLLDGDISMNGNLLINGSNITSQITDTSNNLSTFQTRVDTSLNTVFNNLETTDTSLNTLTTTVSNKRDSSDLVFNGTTQLIGHIIPGTTGIYDIGTTSKRFRSIYVDEAHLSANTLYIGDTPILGTHSNTIQVKADENQSIDIITTGSGNSKIQSEHDVSILTSGSNADVKVQATGTNSKVRVSGTGGIELTSDVDAQADLLVGGNLTVTGNVITNGTQFTVNSTTVTTADNVIVLNKGEVGTGVTNNIAGLQIDRGSASDFQFVFDESIDKFKSGFVGGTFENIATETYVDASVNALATRVTAAENSGSSLDISMNLVESRLTTTETDINVLDTSMNAVESRLTTTESDIGTLDTSMNSVESRLTTAESDIGSFDTSMNSVETRLTSAESDIGTLDTSMNSVESRLTTAESDIGTLDTSMNSVDTRLTSAESDIGTLDTSMNSVETRLTSAESDIGTLDTSMNSVESRLTTTEADINALDTSMNSVESRLTTTEADINALDTSMNSVGTLIQTAIDDLVGNAGSGYDTLVELQNEIENNDLSLNEVFTNVATKVSKSGDTMTGDLNISKISGTTKISLICPNNSLAGLYMAETYNSETSYYGGSIRYDSGANQLKLGTGNLSPVDALWIGRGQTSVNVVGDINVGGDATINNAHIGAWISANFCAVSHSSFNTAGGYALIQSNGGATFLNSSGTNALSLRQNNADRLVINSSGNVDITNSLSIGGDITLSGNNIKTDDNELNLYSNLNSTASTGYIELRADWSKLAGKLIYFVTDTDGSNYGTTRMTIAQDGNINMTGNLTITNPNEINYKNQTLDARFVPKETGNEQERRVNWSEIDGRRFEVLFGSWANNNTSPYADCIHFNTWSDGTGGKSNLLCLRKVGGFGMRIYQPTDVSYGNTTDYTDYRDCVLADTNGNVAITGILSVGGNATINDAVQADEFVITNSTTGNTTRLGYLTLGGDYGVYIGHRAGAGASNISTQNTAVGYECMYSSIDARYSVCMGYRAGYHNRGDYNNFIGHMAGYGTGGTTAPITGDYNIGIGWQTLQALTSGYNNVCIGIHSATAITTGYNNVCLGDDTLRHSTTGKNNTVMGQNAMRGHNASNPSNGNYNVAIGWNSQYYNSTGFQNTSVGYESMQGFNDATKLTTGYFNTCIGRRSLFRITSGVQNTALGYNAMGGDNSAGISGNNNVCVGYYSGYNITNGANNTFMGYDTGRNSTGSNNLFIGYGSGSDTSSVSYRVGIGYDAEPTEEKEILITAGASNKNQIKMTTTAMRLIFAGVEKFTMLNGNVGIGIETPISKLHIYQNSTDTGNTAGLTIEQGGTGDALLQYLTTSNTRWTTGIDNSDSDKFKIRALNPGQVDAVTITTAGNVSVAGDLTLDGGGLYSTRPTGGTNGFELTTTDTEGKIEMYGTSYSYIDLRSGTTAVDYNLRIISYSSKGEIYSTRPLEINAGSNNIRLLSNTEITGNLTVNGSVKGGNAMMSSAHTSYAAFSHKDVSDLNTKYAVLQGSNGYTYLNSTSALDFRINHGGVGTWNTTRLRCNNNLEVGGDITLSGNTIKSDDNQLDIYPNGSASTSTGWIEMRSSGTTVAGKQIIFNTDTDSSNFGTARMTIAQNGNITMTGNLTADKLKTNTSLHFTTTNLGALTGQTAGTWTIGPYSTNNNLIFYYGSFSVGYLKEDVNVSDINFTGQHHNYGVSELIDETGFIVSSTGNYRNQMTNCDECNKYKITINESLPIVEYSQQINDTKVWGVISDKDDTNTVREQPFGIFVSLYEQAEEDRPLTINSLGEGAVWVSNINGPIKNGDYITTCVLPGLGMKQDDDILHSYTVAKITTDCSFDEMDMVPRKSLKYETVSKTREISKEVEKDVFDHWIDDYEVETYYENVEQQIVDKIIKTIQEEIITYDASGIPNVQIIEKTIEEEVPRVKQMESTDASGNNIITEVPEMETVSVTKTRKIPKMINVTLKDVSNNDLLDSQGYPIIKQYQAKKAVYKKEIIQETITEVYDVSRAVVDPDTQQYVYDIKTDASGNTLYVEKYEMKYIVVSSDKYSVYNDKDHTELYKEFDGNFINVQINGESIIGKTYKMAFLGCTYHCG